MKSRQQKLNALRSMLRSASRHEKASKTLKASVDLLENREWLPGKFFSYHNNTYAFSSHGAVAYCGSSIIREMIDTNNPLYENETNNFILNYLDVNLNIADNCPLISAHSLLAGCFVNVRICDKGIEKSFVINALNDAKGYSDNWINFYKNRIIQFKELLGEMP